MEDFEHIKANSGKLIKENIVNTRLIADWKLNIRKILFEVKEKFTDWIEHFTNKFVKSLNRIEHSKDLEEFSNVDSHLSKRVGEMQDIYLEIKKIFFQIAKSGPAEKLDKIEGYRPNMRKIETDVANVEREIKKQAQKVKKALRETVDLEGLNEKIMAKYLKFLQL